MENLYALKIRSIWSEFAGQRASFWFLCFYLFLEYVRPQSIYPAIDVLPWAQTAIILTITFFLLEGNRMSARNAANKLLLLFFATILLSSIFAYSPADSFENIPIFMVWFIVYFLIINIVNTQAKFFMFLVLYMLWNFKMTQHGFLSSASRGFAYTDWGVTGAPGWFHNSGEFGIQLTIFIPLSIYFIHALRRNWGKLKLLIALSAPLTALVSVVATSSRGALLGAGAAIAWMALNSKKRLAIAIVLVIPLAYGIHKLLPDENVARWESAGADKTSLTRLIRWERGVEIMNDHPLLGVGYANWMRYYRDNYPPEMVTQTWGLSHNIFVDAGAELGYLGLGLFVLMVITVFVNNRGTRRIARELDNKFLYYMAYAFDAGMIGFIVSSSFVSVLFYPYFWVGLAFTVSLNNVAVAALRERDSSAEAISPKTCLSLPSYPTQDANTAKAGAR